MSDWWVLSDTDSGIRNAGHRTLASTLKVNGTETTPGARPKRLKSLWNPAGLPKGIRLWMPVGDANESGVDA
jgi:hypothetical protein